VESVLVRVQPASISPKNSGRTIDFFMGAFNCNAPDPAAMGGFCTGRRFCMGCTPRGLLLALAWNVAAAANPRTGASERRSLAPGPRVRRARSKKGKAVRRAGCARWRRASPPREARRRSRFAQSYRSQSRIFPGSRYSNCHSEWFPVSRRAPGRLRPALARGRQTKCAR